MVKCLQINLNQCKTALQLMYTTAVEFEIEVLLVSESPPGAAFGMGWIKSLDGSSAVISINVTPVRVRNMCE